MTTLFVSVLCATAIALFARLPSRRDLLLNAANQGIVQLFRLIFCGLLLGVAAYASLRLVGVLAKGLQGDFRIDGMRLGAPDNIDLGVASSLFAGVGEELLFTGLLFPWLLRRFTLRRAAVLTAVAFFAVHFALTPSYWQAKIALIGFLFTFSFSLISVALLCYFRSLVPSIAMHVAYDLLTHLLLTACNFDGSVNLGLVQYPIRCNAALLGTAVPLAILAIAPQFAIAMFALMKLPDACKSGIEQVRAAPTGQ